MVVEMNSQGNEDALKEILSIGVEPVQKEENRFDIPETISKNENKNNSLESLMEQGNKLADKNTELRTRVALENGASPSQIAREVMNEMNAEKNAMIHNTFRESNTYASLKSYYEQQLKSQSKFKLFINKLGDYFGFKVSDVINIQHKINLLEEMIKSDYRQEFAPLIEESAGLFLENLKRQVDYTGTLISNVSRESETLQARLDSNREKANESADYIIELKATIAECDEGIVNTRREISKIKNSSKNNMTPEAKEALLYHQKRLDQYISNKKTALDSLRLCEEQIVNYHIEITSLEDETKRAKGLLGLNKERYRILKTNLRQAEEYLRKDKNLGYLALMEAMFELSQVNNDLIKLVKICDDYSRKQFGILKNFPRAQIDPVFKATIDEKALYNDNFTNDLVEKYKTKEI